jgi:hypothetical protein
MQRTVNSGNMTSGLKVCSSALAVLLATMLRLDVASAQPSNTQPSDASLQEDPELLTPIPPAPHGVTDEQVRTRLARKSEPKVRIGLNAGVLHRPVDSAPGSVKPITTYEPGFVWGGHVGIVLLPWLVARASSHVSSREVDPGVGAWGFDTPVDSTPPQLRELSLAGALQLRNEVVPRLSVWGGAGVAWTRVSMSRFTLTDPFVADVETRSGVILELPIHVGLGYSLLTLADSALGLDVVLELRYSPKLSSSGEYFAPQPGQNESVRNDTGERVSIDGMPDVLSARTLLCGIELSF